MSDRTNWSRIKWLMRSMRDSQAKAVEFEDEFHEWEYQARKRIERALVSGMKAEQRYLMDAQFKNAIDSIAAIAEAAVFNEIELTRDEIEQRRSQFETLGLINVPFGMSPDV